MTLKLVALKKWVLPLILGFSSPKLPGSISGQLFPFLLWTNREADIFPICSKHFIYAAVQITELLSGQICHLGFYGSLSGREFFQFAGCTLGPGPGPSPSTVWARIEMSSPWLRILFVFYLNYYFSVWYFFLKLIHLNFSPIPVTIGFGGHRE